VLLCPGFELGARWPHLLGADSVADWRRRGVRDVADATGTPVPLHVGFLDEALAEPGSPAVPCPTLIIHGRRDDVVPVALSRDYAAAHARVTLVEVDDDHALGASIDLIEAETVRFFGLSAAAPAAPPPR
jgi:pimeloyl-ACP methyl ester carboxylesterase